MSRKKIQNKFEGIDATKEVDSPQTLENKERFWHSLKEAITNAFGTKPTVVHGQDDWRTDFYRGYLRNIVKSMIEIKVNADWDIDYVKDVLLFEGKVCVTEVNGTNYCLQAGVHGVNAYNRSQYITIANPILGTFDRVNSVDAAMIYLMSEKTFGNFTELVNIYACKLALCDSSIDMNLMNSKVAFIVNCSSQKQANEAKMIFDKINQGEPVVFYEADGINIGKDMNVFKNEVKQNFVVDMIQDAKRAIVSEFLTYVGINNSAVEKKERLLYDEVNGNNMEIKASVMYSKELVDVGVRLSNKLFPYLNLEINWRYIDELERIEVPISEPNEYSKPNRIENGKSGRSNATGNGRSESKN